MEEALDIDQAGLERLKVIMITCITREMAKEFSAPCTVDVNYDWYFEGIVVRAQQEILGREVERIDVEYPKDWWQAFKKRWLPGWAKARWPVEMVRCKLVARELYPKMALPDKGGVIALKNQWA